MSKKTEHLLKDPKVVSNRFKFFSIVATGLLIFAFSIPLVMSDGSGSYSGIKRQAGLSALTHIQQSRKGIDGVGAIGTLKLRIEDITIDQPGYVSADVLCNETFEYKESSEAPDRYVVSVSEKTILGIQTRLNIVHVCRMK